MLPHGKLYQDPGINYAIHPADLPFTDYIAKCQEIIEQHRQDLAHTRPLIIDVNSPFELPPHGYPEKKPRVGALLIHGLFDSPFLTRDIGAKLQAEGILVRSVLLPGHGTVPGALLNVKYQDWQATVRYGIQTLRNEVEHIFLVGFSTGGSLALLHALQDPTIAGICLLAPAIQIHSPFAFMANWHKGISWAWDRAKWFWIAPEKDYARYSSLPFNAIDQVLKLSRKIKKISKTRSLSCPILMAVSADDKTISSKAALAYFKKYANTNSRTILYTHDRLQREIDPRIQIRQSCYPALHVKNFGHVCIPSQSTNFHYGEQGDFIDASHLQENIQRHGRFSYGELTLLQRKLDDLLFQLKLITQRRRPLTFNPDFEAMTDDINQFIISFFDGTMHPKTT